MKKAYEAPELDILRFEIPDSITDTLSIGNGMIGEEGVEEW